MAEDHPDWDLVGYSRVDFDYWEAEASEAGGATLVEEGVGSADAGDTDWDTMGLGDQETQETPAGDAEQIVQIMDDESTA